MDAWPRAITKGIRYPVNITTKEFKVATSLTRTLDKEHLAMYDDQMALSMAQQKIKKQYELRIFFVGDALYTMAIFSQEDAKTQTDYRNYNHKKPNRFIPFTLPDHISQKLKVFIKKSGLDTGSIDIIYTPKGEYLFLEVNPVGQFSFVSFYCNYNLEKKIAEHLVSIANSAAA